MTSIPWEALSTDAGAFAMVVDPRANIAFASPTWNLILGLSQVSGKPLSDAMGKDFASERQLIHDRVLSGGKPESLLGMVGGHLLRTTFRCVPLSEAPPEPGVLATSCILREGMDLDGVPLAVHHDLGHLQGLTERELELLHHMGNGCSSEDAAERMHRSTRTIEWHRASLGEKLRCDNRVQLARIAIASGLTAVGIETLRLIHRSAKGRRG